MACFCPSRIAELRSADADVSVDLPPAEEDTAAGAEEGTDEGPGAAGPPSDEAPSGAPGGDSGAEEEPSSPEDTAGVAPEEDAEAVEAAGGHGPGEDAEDAPIVLDEKMESYVDEALDRLEVEEVREAKRRNGVSVAARVSKAGRVRRLAAPEGGGWRFACFRDFFGDDPPFFCNWFLRVPLACVLLVFGLKDIKVVVSDLPAALS